MSILYLSTEAKNETIVNVIIRAWKDPEFKEKLFNNPKAALREMHCPVGEGKKVRVVEEGQNYSRDEKIVTIIFPKHPTESHQLIEKEFTPMAAGYVQYSDLFGSC